MRQSFVRFAFLRSDLSRHHTVVNLSNLSAHLRPLHRWSSIRVSHSHGLFDTHCHEPELPTPCVPSCWPTRPRPRLLVAEPECLFARSSAPWHQMSPTLRHGSTSCAGTCCHDWRSIPIEPCLQYRVAVAP